jgi:hypothetical protein
VNVCQNERAYFVRMETDGSHKPLKSLERVKGIEPSYSAWKAAALPLSYTRAGDELSWRARGLNRSMHRLRPVLQRATAGVSRPSLHRPGLTHQDFLPILTFPPTTKGGDPVSFIKRCHLAGIAR